MCEELTVVPKCQAAQALSAPLGNSHFILRKWGAPVDNITPQPHNSTTTQELACVFNVSSS